MTDSTAPRFDPVAFQNALNTTSIGRFLIYRPETETTMTIARREAEEGAPSGTLVLAEHQTAGRGRRGRSFFSPATDNLYFTIVLRCSAIQQRRLPIAVPLAVCKACRDVGVDALIKWPNDVWIGSRKVAGMLIDAEQSTTGAIAFPGIGINVNGDPTTRPELAGIATSLARELGRSISRELLLAAICNQLEAEVDAPEESLIADYRSHSLVLGRPVHITPVGGRPFEAEATAIASDGSLIVTCADGTSHTLTAAEVSLQPSP
jgi:BirA family transcriptional regulator, biotin operon repressor / biotin---[acetyl-CoA-carboxylase] ligase